MKSIKIILFFIIICLFSCKKNIDPNYIIGDWKMTNVLKETDTDLTDLITFKSNDSVYVRLYSNRNVVNQFNGIYKYDNIRKCITIKYDNLPLLELKIKSITKSKLEVVNSLNNNIEIFVKANK